MLFAVPRRSSLLLYDIPFFLASTLDEKVDDEQLVCLQNLVLVSNEAVTAAFVAYEKDQDLVRLAESLKQVCHVLF